MKMVVAYVDPEAVEPIRADLQLTLGSLGISDASCPDAQHATALRYRGAVLTPQLWRRARLECVVPREEVASVVDAVLRHSGEHALGERAVYVMALEEADPCAVGGSSGAQASGSAAQRIPALPDEPTVDAGLVAAR